MQCWLAEGNRWLVARGGIDYARETDGRTERRERRASVPSWVKVRGVVMPSPVVVAMETAVMRGRVVASRSSGGVRTSGVSIPCGNVDSVSVPNDDCDETTTTFLARVGGEVVVDFATRDESLEPSTSSSSSSSSLSWEVTHAMSGRRLAVDAGGVRWAFGMDVGAWAIGCRDGVWERGGGGDAGR